MENKNALTKKMQSLRFSDYLDNEAVRTKIVRVLSSPKNAQRFKTAIVSLVSSNPALGKCSHSTLLAAAIAGESLKLPPPYVSNFDNITLYRLTTARQGKKLQRYELFKDLWKPFFGEGYPFEIA